MSPYSRNMNSIAMNHIIPFNVIRNRKGYLASSAGLHYGIFTDGKTFEDLVENIKKATDLYFEETDWEGTDPADRPFLLFVEIPPASEDEDF